MMHTSCPGDQGANKPFTGAPNGVAVGYPPRCAQRRPVNGGDKLPFAVIVLRARTNRLADLKPLVPLLLLALSDLQPGEVKWVEG